MTARLLQLYRVLAIVTGIGLIILTLVGVPLKYAAGRGGVVSVVGALHGFLYMAYVVVTLLLAYVRRWSILKAVLVLAAGTVPFAAFFAEHRVMADERRLGRAVEHPAA